jgi:DNA-binding NtrC family response regulator
MPRGKRERPMLNSVFHQVVRRARERIIHVALRSTGGNVTHAARRLGITRPYLLRLIREFSIDVSTFR